MHNVELKHFLLSICRILALGLVLAPPALASEPEGDKPLSKDGRVINRQVRIETKDSWVEVEVTSSRPFPVRALRPVLRIGTRDFMLSRHGGDERMNTLIFRIPASDFAQLRAAAAATVFYASGTPAAGAVPETGGQVWDFGKFRKELLDQPREK